MYGKRLKKMLNQIVWDNILEASKFPRISEFSRRYDLSESMIINKTGKPSIEQTIDILDMVRNLDYETAVVLPEGFLYDIDARTVRKNVRPIMLRRIYTKTKAIEEQITPTKLIKEKIDKLQECYLLNSESLLEDFAGINYRGIRDGKIKNYLISDSIEGFQHAEKAGPLIHIKRYDTLENLLKSKASRKLSFEDKAKIRRELLKIRKRKIMVPEKARKIILTKQAERVVEKVPSRSEKGKYYNNIKFRKIPVSFIPDDKEFYASWTDFCTEPSCNCKDKVWFISYLKPGQIWHCVHEIAAFRKSIAEDWNEGKPAKQPYMATSPFFKPSKKTIELYTKWRNQVFTKKENNYGNLAKVYRDIWLLKDVIRGKVDLF